MKNIIDRIAEGGTKIAGYLAKAVSTRLAVAALAALAAGGAWAAAPTPTVVWESDFGTSKTVDGSTFEIVPNSASIDANGNLAIGASTGNTYTSPTLAIPEAFQSDKITVLIKYSGLAAYSDANAALSSVKVEYGGSSIVYGLRSNGSGHLDLIGYNESTASVQSLGSTVSLGTGAGYYLVSTDTGVGVYGYTGTHVKGLSGSSTALKKDSNYKVTSVSLGGSHGVNKAYAWAGVTIEKVAIFIGNAYSNTDLADYVWPSSKYAKWAYSNRVMTWKTAANATGNSGDYIASADATYDIFDLADGVDSGSTASGGLTTSSLAFWKNFCFGQEGYAAPGNVLRLSGDSYYKNVHGKFSPMTIGGLIVEEGATGYSFPAEGNRSAALGDPTGSAETWFEINEDFSIARTGGVALMGTVNLDIANEKTLTLSSAAKMMQVASVDTATAPQLPYATTTGGTLKLHGAGKLAATLNASGAALDFTDQPTASASAASAYIQGALTVDVNTTFTFPAGATFPYFVATSISGDLYPSNGYKANANGSISAVTPTVLNITSAQAVDLPTAWTSSDDAVVTVAAGIDATLNVTAAATLSTITFNVPATSTLTISGAAIAASSIYLPGEGVVKVSSAGALAGTAKGPGVLQYNGVLPTITSGISFSNAAWTGTMWLKDFGSLSTSGRAGVTLTADMPNWGNAGSKVRFTNVKAYAHNANLTCAYTLVLEDGAGSDEYAWRCDDGYANNTLTVAKLSGTGTFYDHSGPTAAFKFNSCNNFTGVFDISSSSCHRIGLGANCNSTGGTIAIGSGVVVNLEQGKVWTAGGGFVVNAGGTLNVNADATVKFASGQSMLGTLNIAQDKTLTAASSDAVSYNTGSSTVNVYGTLNFDTFRWTIGPSTVVNLYEGAIVKGTGDSNNSNAAMDFNVSGGSTIHALGNATVSCTIRNNAANGTAKINVDEGKTLTFSGNLVGSYGFKKQGAGILKLTGSIAKLPTIEDGTVLLGGSKAWNFDTVRDLTGYALEAGSSIAITQILAEYRCGVTTVTGLDESIASITVNKYDGTTATLMRTDSTSTLTETPVTSGVACWYDFTFTNTVKSATGSSGSSTSLTPDVSSFEYVTIQDYAQPTPNSYTAIPTYARPYSGINLGSKTQFCVALFGKMPSPDNTVLLFLGDGYDGGALILASGTSANEAVLYYYTTGKVLTELKRMPASSCRTAPHLYVFQKVGDHQVDIYLDGKLSLSYVNNDITFTLNTGFQVASGYRGTPTGLSEISKSETSEPSAIAMTRIYDRLLTSAEITQLAIEWPYYSPNGDSSRTLDVGETTPDWVETGKWLFNNTSADAAAANSNVEFVNNAGAAASVAVNLNANTAYESLAVSGDNAVSFALKSGFTGKIVPGAATFSADTTVAYDAADFSSTRVEVADGKTLTFDVSSIVTANGNWPNAASVDRIQLTGIATLGTGATVAVTPATAGYWNLSAVEDGGYYYLSVAPNRAIGEIYWQSGYWSGGSDNKASFTTDRAGTTATKYFAGDTVVVPNTTQRWMGTISDGATIKYDCSGTINISKTGDLGYVLKNATVIVASGTTLNFVNQGASAPEVYGGTISGAGKVKVESGKTLTLSNGATLASETALTGAGEVVLASVPTAQMTFDNWTGTVKLPAIASGAIIFNKYGTTGSTVHLTSMSSGAWIQADNTTINPKLYLEGDMTLSAMSPKAYTFAEIDGPGNLSFATSGSQPTEINITKVAEGYSGTISSTLETPVTIDTLALGSGANVSVDAKLLSTGGTGAFSVTAVTVGGEAQTLTLSYRSDGVYVRGVASYDNVEYKTIQEAINAAVQAGQTYAAVTILDPAAECPDEYYVDNGTLKKKPAAVCKAGTLTYYTTIELAMQKANEAAYMAAMGLGTGYDYVIFFENAAVTQILDGMKIKQVAGVTVTVATSSAEFTSTPGAADAEGIVTYALANAPTAYTWTDAYFERDPQTGESVEDHRWSSAGNWSFGSGTTATRYPQSGDTVSFSSASTVTLDANAACASMTIAGCAVSISADSAKTLAAGTISLTAAESSISVTDVTLSPVPTTTVANAYVKTTTAGSTTTYAVADNPRVTITAAEPVFQDYTNATLRATIAADSGFDAANATYTATVGGQGYAGVYADGAVTFEIPGAAGSSANVTITATPQDGGAAVSSTTAFVFGTATDWFEETATTFGDSGTWANADTTADKIVFSGDANATFTPTKTMTGNTADVVWVVSFDAPNDDDLSEELVGAQTAFRLATGGFQLWVTNESSGAWVNVAATGITPAINTEYTVTNHFDYSAHTLTVTVNGVPLAKTGGATTFALPSGTTKVNSFEFAGSGALTGIAGNFINTMLYVDGDGNAYATLADALKSGNPVTALDPSVILTVEPGLKLTVPTGMTAANIKPTYNGASIAGYVNVSIEDGKVTLSATEAAKPSATAMTADGIAVGNVKPGLYYWVEASTRQDFATKTNGTPVQAASDAALSVAPPNPTGKVIFYRVAVDAEEPAPATP